MNTIATTMAVEQNRCYSMLASLLEYPNDELLNTCDTLVSEVNSGVAEPLRTFRDYVATHPLSRIQEIYTGTFDLMASCSPYLGIHIFGEDNYKRGALMASMNTEMPWDRSPQKIFSFQKLGGKRRDCMLLFRHSIECPEYHRC